MFIEKAVIHYNARLDVAIDGEGMTIEQDSMDDSPNQRVFLIPDELRDLVELAKLLGWEGF